VFGNPLVWADVREDAVELAWQSGLEQEGDPGHLHGSCLCTLFIINAGDYASPEQLDVCMDCCSVVLCSCYHAYMRTKVYCVLSASYSIALEDRRPLSRTKMYRSMSTSIVGVVFALLVSSCRLAA